MIARVQEQNVGAAKGKSVSVAKSVRVLGFFSWATWTLSRNGWPRVLISYNGGIGDDLLCTTVARELNERNAGTVWVATRFPELFDGSPDGCAVPIEDWRIGRLGHVLGARVRTLGYTQYDPKNDCDPEPPMHFAAMMCLKAGISGPVAIRPYIFLRRDECANGKIARNQIAIQSSSRAAATPIPNKEWSSEGFQAVVNALSGHFQFVQLGSPADPRLDNVIDLRGKTTLRQAAAVVSQSRLFIGLPGGLMHLARAVDCPAVIIYGGRERPEISGYICNSNITSMPPCSPCWQRSRCDYERVCMTSIDARDVVAATGEILMNKQQPLPVKKVFV